MPARTENVFPIILLIILGKSFLRACLWLLQHIFIGMQAWVRVCVCWASQAGQVGVCAGVCVEPCKRVGVNGSWWNEIMGAFIHVMYLYLLQQQQQHIYNNNTARKTNE